MADESGFHKFFSDQVESLTKTAFPQLSKFMDFSSSKEQNEAKASDSVSSSENDIGTPNRRKSGGSVANEMVLDSLTGIDERLKVQSIVLVSQLEQQTITNQLLNRLTVSGLGSGGGAGGNSNTPNIPDIPGEKSIGNYIKTWGKKLLGGAAGLIMENPVTAAVAGAGVAGVAGAEWIRRTDHNEDTGPNAPNKTGEALQSEINILKADIEREKQHLALNPTDAATLAILKKLQDKLDRDEDKSKLDEATPQHNWGPWHAGGTPQGL